MEGLLATCLVCKNHLVNSKSLLKERTAYTKTLMITKLSKIVRKKLEPQLLAPAEICGTCQSLLNLVDEHESKLLAYENEVRLKFKLPFPIVLEDKNDAAPPPIDDQPITEPELAVAANGDLEPGPNDVIVSADDTGLVTVTYSQPDADLDPDRPPGATSPAVIWDGDSDQQIIIFNEEDDSPVAGLLESLAPAESPPPKSPAASRLCEISSYPPPPPPPSLPPPRLPPAPPKPPLLRVQTPSRPFYCDLCDAPFASTDALADHRATHELLKFGCSFCPERCATTIELSRHMNRAHPLQLLPCTFCHKRFAKPSLLRQHMLKHQEKQHACPMCPKRFFTLHELRLHSTYKHSDERPYSCDVCRRAFKSVSVLNRHKLRHTGLKMYPCTVCGARFAHKFTMEQHALVHGSLPHVCATCGKKFALQRSLDQHVRMMHVETQLVS